MARDPLRIHPLLQLWIDKANTAESDLATCVAALERIAGEDYRGPRPRSIDIAKSALATLQSTPKEEPLGTCDNNGIDHVWQSADHHMSSPCVNFTPLPTLKEEPHVFVQNPRNAVEPDCDVCGVMADLHFTPLPTPKEEP